jgi:hypothetical protein
MEALSRINILGTPSQDGCLKLQSKCLYVKCCFKALCTYTYKLMSKEPASLIAASLRFGWFPLFPLDIWCC